MMHHSGIKRALRVLFASVIVIAAGWGFGSTATNAGVGTTDHTGGGQSHMNHQPGLGINYLIAVEGVYPSRNSPPASDITTLSTNPHVGEITMFAGNFAPRGWAFTDGQLLPVSQYSALFSLLGTTYGGDGRTNFALPDLRDRSAMHHGSGPGLTSRRLGERIGADNVTLTATQARGHVHPMNPPIYQTIATGGSQAHANMKPSLAINFNVALFGADPASSSTSGDISTQSVDPFLGAVQMFAGNFAPRATAQADGQLLPINGNEALFSLLGTTYGGDGRTTFALPDLRGRLTMHEGNGPGLTNRRLGSKVGVEQVTLIQNTTPSHTHNANHAVFNAGGGQGHENMQPTNTLNYIIALQGTFPSRNSTDGDVTTSSLDPFLGEIAMFAGNFAPPGWAFADGQLLQISQHQALHSLLQTTYGGDGRTTFALPDLRGRVPVHVGGSDSGLFDWDLGERYGQEKVWLTTNQLPSHAHNYATSCDLDIDGDCDVNDVDLLVTQGDLTVGLFVPPLAEKFDLTADGDVDTDDYDDWLAIAATKNGHGSAYRSADTDLDRDVDITDFNTLSSNFDPGGTNAATNGHSKGNNDGDNDIDIGDFNNLAGQFTGGTTYDSAAAAVAADANPGEVDLIVDLATGEVILDGNAAAISGLQVFSAGNSLLATDFTADVLQFVISTNASTYAEGAFVNTGVDGLVSLGILYDLLVNAQDLTFEYTMIGQPTVRGTVAYIPEPASLTLLSVGGLLVLRRRRAA